MTILHHRLSALAFAVILAFGNCANAQPILDSLFAPSLGQTRAVVILLPAQFDSAARYPILYLLHGYGGSHMDWTERTGIEEFIAEWPLIVVMPDAGNSWYVNSRTRASDRYEDYIIHDVRLYVEGRFRVDSTRRAIVGLSMGGYGALMLAMRHPDLYRFAGSLSGAVVVPRSLLRPVDIPPRPATRSTQQAAFGELTEELFKDYDLQRLVSTLTPSTSPYMYLVTGIQDALVEFLPAQRALTEELRNAQLPYEFHETPGGHSWPYWDREIRPMLTRMREVLRY